MRSLVLATLLLALAACRPADEAAPPKVATPAPAESPADAPPADATPPVVVDTTPVDARVVDVALANRSADGKTLSAPPTDHFHPTDAVYAAIRTDGSAAGYTLSAKWLAPDGATLTEYGQVVPAAGPAQTLFSLSRPDGWPKGRYTIALAINGVAQKEVAFSVE